MLDDARAITPLLNAARGNLIKHYFVGKDSGLYLYRTRQCIPTLILLLRAEEAQVRTDAAGYLRELTGMDYGEDAASWRAWWEQEGR